MGHTDSRTRKDPVKGTTRMPQSSWGEGGQVLTKRLRWSGTVVTEEAFRPVHLSLLQVDENGPIVVTAAVPHGRLIRLKKFDRLDIEHVDLL